MDTQVATKQIRIREWATIIQDRINSGLTVNAYCAEHGLTRNAYFYWLRRVKEAALVQAGFVEIKSSPEPAGKIGAKEAVFAPELMMSIGEITIGVSSKTPMSLLSQVLGVIRHVE